MDMENQLIFESEYFRIEADSDYQHHFTEGYPFEPMESKNIFEEENTLLDSSHQIVDEIKAKTDIALTPMNDIMLIAKNSFDWNSICENELRKKIKRSKMIEKRERAKNRKSQKFNIERPIIETIGVIAIDQTEDIKKQKNRLSAQISRDRKKEYYNNLETENESLKKTIMELNKSNSELRDKMYNENVNPKSTKESSFKNLLILLGLIFLLNLIKNCTGFGAQKETNDSPISKLELSKVEKNFIVTELSTFGLEIPFESLYKETKEGYMSKSLADKIMESRSINF